MRRAVPARLSIIVSGRDVLLSIELVDVLAAIRGPGDIVAPGPPLARRDADDLVRADVAADGISDDEKVAYRAAEPDLVRSLHDARAHAHSSPQTQPASTSRS